MALLLFVQGAGTWDQDFSPRDDRALQQRAGSVVSPCLQGVRKDRPYCPRMATASPRLTEAESPAAGGPACSGGCSAPLLSEQHVLDASHPSMLSCVRGLSCRESGPSVRRLLYLPCSHPLGPSLLPSLCGQARAVPLGVLFLMIL